jgi:hypothetical protein
MEFIKELLKFSDPYSSGFVIVVPPIITTTNKEIKDQDEDSNVGEPAGGKPELVPLW